MPTTPCSDDFEGNGTDWTRGDFTRQEAMDKARACHGCPIREACFNGALEESPHTEGIWGGHLWKPGVRKATHMDPLGIESGNMRSVYKWVFFDKGKWRVVKERVSYGSFDNEDEAGRVALALFEEDD